MFNWKEFEKTKQIFSQAGESIYKEFHGQHHIMIRPKDLIRWIDLLKEDLEYLTLVDIAAVDRKQQLLTPSYQFELVYHLLNMGNHQRLNIHLHFNRDEVIPSISSFYPHAEWMEREQAEMLNLRFDRGFKNLLLPDGQKIFPLLKEALIKDWPLSVIEKLPELRKNPNKTEAPYPEESYEWKKFDLFSPQSMGNFEWLVCFDPVKTVRSEVQIGFHHQGFEKFLEGKGWLQVMQLVDKIQLGAAPTYSIAWAKNLEDNLRIKLPERAQAIRIVMLELARLAEHLTVLLEMTYAIELDEYRFFINAREKIYELFEKYCGHRQGIGIAKLGGLREDLPHGWVVEYQSVADILSKSLHLIHRSLISQHRFRDCLEGAPVNAQVVLQAGVSGPTMRASGLNFDLRKSQPFYFYQDIDFDIPVGIHGTAYDRYLIRFEECLQSLRIITQVLDNLPLGEVINPIYDQTHPDMSHISEQGVSLEWHYSCLESPNGEAGFFLLPDKTFSPYRVKIKTPSFPLAQALPQFTLGLRAEQLRASLASLGIRRYEVDR